MADIDSNADRSELRAVPSWSRRFRLSSTLILATVAAAGTAVGTVSLVDQEITSGIIVVADSSHSGQKNMARLEWTALGHLTIEQAHARAGRLAQLDKISRPMEAAEVEFSVDPDDLPL